MICKVGKKVFWNFIWLFIYRDKRHAFDLLCMVMKVLLVCLSEVWNCSGVVRFWNRIFYDFMYFTVDHLHFIFKYFSLKISSHNNFVSKLHDSERCRGRWYDWRSSDFALGYFTSKIRSQQHKSFEKIITFVIFGG